MLNKKFIESFEVDDWQVETETGWEELEKTNKTIPYDVWEIRTKSFILQCADNHIIIDKEFNEVYVQDLIIGDEIITRNGIEKIESIKNLQYKDNMYDLTINSKKHTYFTNGILSHNTTMASIYLVHYAIFNQDKTIAILANKEKTSLEIMRRIKMVYEELPLWLQAGITQGGWNKSSLLFGNGSRLIAASTASSAIRGEVISCLYLDEFAFVPTHIAEDFMGSVYPTITSGKTSKVIISSTPCGMNHFYNIWDKSIKGRNNYYPVKVGWWEHPYRDEEFKKSVIRDLGVVRWNSEYACKFIGSTNTLIDSEILERIDVSEPISTKWNGLFQIFEEPIFNKMYILGIDAAEGIGKDFSVIQVLKINGECEIEQVAVFRSNMIESSEFAQISISISEYYNHASIMVENNGVGAVVSQIIWYDYEYDYIINCDKKGLGVRSTRKSKLEGNLLVKRYLENEWLILHDRRTVYELSLYEEVKPNVFQSDRTSHDDHVTSLIWGLYFVSTPFFDGKNLEVKEIEDKYKIDNIWDEVPVALFDGDEYLEEIEFL